MKGIILAAGGGTRLRPVTKVVSKPLLLVYDRPMIYYPIETLVKAGVTEILIITAPEFAGDYLKLLGGGKDFGVRFMYEVQEEKKGTAHAFLMAESFVGDDDCVVLYADNLFEDDLSEKIKNFQGGATVFVKEVKNPSIFGVVEMDAGKNKVLSIEEKPENPKSNFVITGTAIFDKTAFEKVKKLKPSKNGEIILTEALDFYLSEGKLNAEIIDGAWFDTGTFDAMVDAINFMKNKSGE